MRAFLTLLVLISPGLVAAASCTLDNKGTGGGSFTNPSTGSGGAAPACAAREDCPDDTPCSSYACTNGECQVSLSPSGTPIAGSPVGDCQRNVCNGAGSPVSETDNNDKPDDGNDCTIDDCNDGTPTHVNAANGADCGMGTGDLHCESGMCVGCISPDQCSHNPCQDATCVNTVCGTTPKPAGTEAENGDVSPTDCLHDVCDGNGGTTTEADPNDVPADDGNPCTGEACNGTNPTHPNLMNGMQCPTGFCYSGACSECGVVDTCTPMECNTVACNGTCVYTPVANSTQCGSGQHCFNGSCSQCAQATDCTPNACETATCPNGTCQYQTQADGTPCSGGACCAGTCTMSACSDAGVDGGAGGAGGDGGAGGADG